MRKRVLFFLFVLLMSAGLLSASFFKPKFALVLSGGGAKGLAHIPIIQELDRRGIVPDKVLGTSAAMRQATMGMSWRRSSPRTI